MNRLTARQRRNLGESLSGYSFILPQMLGFILFVLVPLVNVFIYSFQNKNMLSARALSAAGITMKNFSAIPCLR